MPRPRPLYLRSDPSRHGKPRWCVKKPGENKIRIFGVYGDAGFMVQYRAAVAGKPVAVPTLKNSPRGTLAWLWEEYRKSGEWSEFSKSTRSQRENVMIGVLKKCGKREFSEFTADDIVGGRDEHVAHVAAAEGQARDEARRQLHDLVELAIGLIIDFVGCADGCPGRLSFGSPAIAAASVTGAAGFCGTSFVSLSTCP